VCPVLYCAHPSYTQGYYDRDNDFYLAWDEISKTRESVLSYLDEWVYGVRDRQEYWQKLGQETHKRLQVASRPSVPVDYGQY
jgi:glutaconate CoA-transferase, subunit A